MYFTYTENDAFNGTVRDLAITMDGGRNPQLVWTGDDMLFCPECSKTLKSRNNLIVAFKYADFDFGTMSGPPASVVATYTYRVDVKPGAMFFELITNSLAQHKLWIAEYNDPAPLRADGTAGGGRPKFGAGPSQTRNTAKKSRRPGPDPPPNPRACW